MKTHLYYRFKLDALGPSQGSYPTDAFPGPFEDIHRTFLQNCVKKQQLTFNYFTQHIW